MKSIDTLVEDIYALFENEDWVPTEEAVLEFGHNLARHLSKRASENKQGPSLRASNIGYPDRKLWFSINKPETAEKLSPATRIKFLYGDLIEELILFLAKEAGHEVRGQQDAVEIHGVFGSRDAVVDGELVDVKSASTMSFRKFEDNSIVDNDPFGYIDQLNFYLNGATDVNPDRAHFLAVDKTLGNITLNTQPRKYKNYVSLISNKREMLSKTTPPLAHCYSPVPEGKSGNLKLDTGCSYCAFKWECWPSLRAFAYSNKPVYLVEVKREPKVPEFNKDGKVINE